jgi:tripartite-type tricarboxylate transporter receptor subunit TctC
MMRIAPLIPVLSLIVASPPALAQDAYPVKPVRMIAPFPPGGSTDTLARIVAQKLTDALGRQVIVENRPGASAIIGHEVAAKAPPDGYTLLLTSKGGLVHNLHLFKRLSYDPLNDFAPISVLALAGPVLVVHPTVPARSVKEFVALARARPGQLNYGSGGRGTSAHIVAEVFQSITGVKLVHVAYKGGVLAVTDVVAGQIELSFSDMVPAVPQIKAGRLRGLAVTTAERSPAIPDVPTMAEAGVAHPFPIQWWALAGPKGLPAAVVNRINAELAQIMKLPDVRDRYVTLGIFTAHTTPERMMEMVRSEIPEVGRILKAAGIEPD